MQVHTMHAFAAGARGRRLELGWSQTETAARAGVSRKWVSDFETGRTRADLTTVLRLLDALGLVIEMGTATPASASASDPASIDLDAVLARYEPRR